MELNYYKGRESVQKENSGMYPAELFGVECGDGWSKLIQPALDAVSEENRKRESEGLPGIRILQVKEKFGRLRIYLSEYTEELKKIIGDAEDKSWNVCEDCGSETDIVHTAGWVMTLCRKCFERKNEKAGGYFKLAPVTPKIMFV